jgi:hypothetical protein
MLKTTGMSDKGEYVQDINGMRVDRRSQRVRKIFGEIVQSPSATVTEKLASATIQARDASHAAQRQTHVQFDTAVVPQSNHSQGRFSQKPPSSQHTKAAPEGAKALVMRNSLPASSASVKSGVAESNGGSKRQIRTGGFQKLGQELTTTK